MSENSPYEAPESDVSVMSTASKLTLKEILFSFQGRVPRKVFWLYGFVGMIIFMLVAGGIIGALVSAVGEFAWILAVPAYIFLIWASLAIQVKRWHDRDKSGWWVLIGLIPLIGAIWQFVECGFLKGIPNDNQYGPIPAEY